MSNSKTSVIGSYIKDLKNKDLWTEKFINMPLELKYLEREEGKLAARYQWANLSKCRKKDGIIFEAWNYLSDFYGQVNAYSFGTLTISESIYYCEQLFSDMSIIKNKLRSTLNDESLKNCMK